MARIVLLVVLWAATGLAIGPSAAAGESRAGYEAIEVRRWTVLVSSEFKSRDPRLLARCLEVLSDSLRTIIRVVPSAALSEIRTVPIWLEYEDSRFRGGVYHPSRKWLLENGMNPAKAQSVQFTKNLATWIKDQPMMVLHELAHAYHDRVLTHQYPPIIEAYERALASGKYDNVERNNGRRERAYALTNDREFFAELSEAYFGRNDFYPYTRKHLQSFDPESSAVIARAWHRR